MTDADAPAPVARPTVTDADAPVARPTVTDAETPVAPAHRHDAGRRPRPTTTRQRRSRCEPGPPTASTETLVPPPVKRRGRRTAVLAGTLAVVAVAGTAGAIAGSSDGETPAPAPPRVAALDAGAAKVSVPATWQRTQDGPAIPGLEFDEPASVAGAGGELVTGRLPEAGGRTAAAPRTSSSRCPRRPSSANAVKLGPVEAYRYDRSASRRLRSAAAAVRRADGRGRHRRRVRLRGRRLHGRVRGGRLHPEAERGRGVPARPGRGLRRPPRRRRSASSATSAATASRRCARRRRAAGRPTRPTTSPRATPPRAARSAIRRPTRRFAPPPRRSRPRSTGSAERLRGPGRGGPRRPRTSYARAPAGRHPRRFALPCRGRRSRRAGVPDVSVSPLGPHRATAAELKDRAEAERRGHPFLVYRDPDDRQVLVMLEAERVTVGRRPDTDLSLAWDAGVSRTHAELERIGREWVLVDDGLSQNGSFVNETRVIGRRRLANGDVLRFGRTLVAFCAPRATELEVTADVSDVMAAANIPPAQRRVLVELCRPLLASPPARRPGLQQADRRAALPQRRGRQDPPAGAVARVRRRRAAAEREADRARRARARDRRRHQPGRRIVIGLGAAGLLYEGQRIQIPEDGSYSAAHRTRACRSTPSARRAATPASSPTTAAIASSTSVPRTARTSTASRSAARTRSPAGTSSRSAARRSDSCGARRPARWRATCR